MSKLKTQNCYNCGNWLQGIDNELYEFCPKCGQENTQRTISFKELMKDMFHALFNFESKFYKSVFNLLFKPGKITLDYIHGKRVEYVKPMRLFIFSGFLNILILSLFLFTFTGYEYPILNLGEDTVITLSTNVPDSSKLSETEIEEIKAEWEQNLEQASGIQRFAMKRLINHLDITAADFFKNCMRSISYLNFLLIPILGLILFIFYRKKSTYLENLIHSIHLLSNQNIVLIVFVTFLFSRRFISEEIQFVEILITGILSLYSTVYFITSMKKFKNEKFGLTILKFSGVSFIYSLFYLLVISFAILFSLTIF